MTKLWELYQRGQQYNQSLVPNQYNLVETNTEFFIGNQWIRLPAASGNRNLPRPVFNILKRVGSLFVASLTSTSLTVRYTPLAYYDHRKQEDPDHDIAELATALVQNQFNKLGMDYYRREALFDGVVTGDYCAHYYFDPAARPTGHAKGPYRGEIKMELVDGIDVHFGNPHTTDVQSQPYILLVGRAPVKQLREEMRRYRHAENRIGSGGKYADKTAAEQVQPDYNFLETTSVGARTELLEDDETGQAVYGVLYEKIAKEVPMLDEKGNQVFRDEYDDEGNPVYLTDNAGQVLLADDGAPIRKKVPATEIKTTVHVTKGTRTEYIFEDVDTGLDLYPIAWGVWEKQSKQYHGRALVTGLAPNQIFINNLFAKAMHHMETVAFPKVVYNQDVLPRWDSTPGVAVGLRGVPPGTPIGQYATVLQPAEMSNQVFTLIDKAVEYTKECMGATDAQLGSASADNTSALMVLQTNSEVPLENVQANQIEWVHNCADIILDMAATYYGTRDIVMDRDFEEPVTGPNGAPQIDPMTGMLVTQTMTRKVQEAFDFSRLKHVALDSRVDVGATTYFSEIAMTQTLDNLRRDGTMDVIQYLERLPSKLIPRKAELISQIRSRMAAGAQQNAAAGAAIPQPGAPISASRATQGGPLDAEKAAQGLATPSEGQLSELPQIAKKTAYAQGAMRSLS